MCHRLCQQRAIMRTLVSERPALVSGMQALFGRAPPHMWSNTAKSRPTQPAVVELARNMLRSCPLGRDLRPALAGAAESGRHSTKSGAVSAETGRCRPNSASTQQNLGGILAESGRTWPGFDPILLGALRALALVAKGLWGHAPPRFCTRGTSDPLSSMALFCVLL